MLLQRMTVSSSETTHLSSGSNPLIGEVILPGDKSISHRAVMAALIQPGMYTLTNLADNADVKATLGCLTSLGGKVAYEHETVVVTSPTEPWQIPNEPLDCHNSGTTLRLMTGLLAGKGIPATLIGDQSLQRRPMGRILTPLAAMGASIAATPNTNWQGNPCQTAPLVITKQPLHGTTYTLPMASAQVKSALLLAGLHATGETVVIEPTPSRDHTERLFQHLGLPLTTTKNPRSGLQHMLSPNHAKTKQDRTTNHHWMIPGDISSAAFLMVAGLLTPGSRVVLKNVGINPTRTGILDVFQQWGVTIDQSNMQRWQGEPVADLTVTHQPLNGGVTIAGDLIPRLIDELPIIAIASLASTGRLIVKDAEELRHKESDRIALLEKAFQQLNLPMSTTNDGFVIEGLGLVGLRERLIPPNKPLPTGHDHRIAMGLRVLNHICQSDNTWPLDHPECMAVSFPNFESVLARLTAS